MIALLVLLPESIAAVRAAAREKVQVSLNLAMGSAMASIGLTIPTIAIASIWLDGPLALGPDNVQIVLLFLTVVVGILTVVPGRAKPLRGGVHPGAAGILHLLDHRPLAPENREITS
ncbi:hypothetical protein [Nocardioides sp. B-3]|uniref:hypothetical protein n=1 Tax=Nocardioides sp. B-3 TaxID=2895565 RepID=UPI002152AF47|nr:hypothetical protein [Nocardioides sp. B-3]UUZ60519.1 hypothetical protein LP418_06510 [Nocardioides sp. B-3]